MTRIARAEERTLRSSRRSSARRLFRAGGVDTGFIDRELGRSMAKPLDRASLRAISQWLDRQIAESSASAPVLGHAATASSSPARPALQP